jgi:hypothetical protein
MAIKFVRCNALLSLAIDKDGNPCRYISKGADDNAVIADMTSHISSIHDIEGDDHVGNIKISIKTH